MNADTASFYGGQPTNARPIRRCLKGSVHGAQTNHAKARAKLDRIRHVKESGGNEADALVEMGWTRGKLRDFLDRMTGNREWEVV